MSGAHAEALAVAREVLGEVEVLGCRRGEQAALVAVGKAGEVRAWVKHHAEAAAARREAAVLTAWGGALGGPTPRVLALRGRSLVLAHVRGRPWRPDDPGHVAALVARLDSLHQTPIADPDPMPLATALAARARAALSGAGDVPRDVETALAAPWPDRPRVAAHRDVRPENLVVTESGEVALLDLGQARPDGAEADVVGLIADPATRDAGWAVAGALPSVDPALAVRRLRLFQVATVARARRRGEPTGAPRSLLDVPIAPPPGKMRTEARCARS